MKKIIIAATVVIVIAAIAFFFFGRNKKSKPAPAMNETQPMTPVPLPRGDESTKQAMGENTVEIKNFTFNPSITAVKKGDTVTWTNNDSATHTVTSSKDFDSGNLAPGQTFSHIFNDTGTFEYRCSIHTFMTGKVIVQ